MHLILRTGANRYKKHLNNTGPKKGRRRGKQSSNDTASASAGEQAAGDQSGGESDEHAVEQANEQVDEQVDEQVGEQVGEQSGEWAGAASVDPDFVMTQDAKENTEGDDDNTEGYDDKTMNSIVHDMSRMSCDPHAADVEGELISHVLHTHILTITSRRRRRNPIQPIPCHRIPFNVGSLACSSFGGWFYTHAYHSAGSRTYSTRIVPPCILGSHPCSSADEGAQTTCSPSLFNCGSRAHPNARPACSIASSYVRPFAGCSCPLGSSTQPTPGTRSGIHQCCR
jgi:hypothetical protein